MARESMKAREVKRAKLVAKYAEKREKLKAEGVHLINPPWNFSDRGFISTCFRDPDGNLIELEQILI